MSDHTLTIVFRNEHPQRTPICSELKVVRGDTSSPYWDYADQANSDQLCYLEARTEASISLSQSPF